MGPGPNEYRSATSGIPARVTERHEARRRTLRSLRAGHSTTRGVRAIRSPGSSGRCEAHTTRRRFLKWTTGVVVGASALTGKLVGFTPTAEAAPIAGTCKPYSPGTPGNCLACFGTCESLQSCCRALIDGAPPYCCCTCPGGPLSCFPTVFRAENYCQGSEALCCCGTCFF
jgi:hypothetical protein